MPKHHQGCQNCEWEGDVWVKPNEHPPCPECGSPTQRVWQWNQSSASVITDDIPGGQRFYNGFDEPEGRIFYSHSEHRRALKERGLQIHAKWAGPLDKYLINWAAAMDPQTLENAKVLVSRGVRVTDERPARFQAPDPDVTITSRRVDR